MGEGYKTIPSSSGAVTGSVSTQGLSERGLITLVNLTPGAWAALPTPALTRRNAILIKNSSGEFGASQDIKVNYDNTDIGRPLPAGYEGKTVIDGGEAYYDITDSIPIYAKSKTSACTITVEELA